MSYRPRYYRVQLHYRTETPLVDDEGFTNPFYAVNTSIEAVIELFNQLCTEQWQDRVEVTKIDEISKAEFEAEAPDEPGRVWERAPEQNEPDRSGFDMTDGIPRCAVDLPSIHYRGDLADHVLPAWDQVGIEYQCYSTSSRGTLMMIGDPARQEEAARIALYWQLQLQRHFSEFGLPEMELTLGSGRRIGVVRRAGRTVTVTIDDDATISLGGLHGAVDWTVIHVRHMVVDVLNAERVIGLPPLPKTEEEERALIERIRLPEPEPTAEEIHQQVRETVARLRAETEGATAPTIEQVKTTIERVKERSAGRTATAPGTMVDIQATED